jgi:hypothetical protein
VKEESVKEILQHCPYDVADEETCEGFDEGEVFMYERERKERIEDGEEGKAGDDELNWETERRKRKVVIGSQISGTTHHFVRVRICVWMLARRE